MIVNWIPLMGGLFFGLIPPRLLINTECRYLRFDGVWSKVAAVNKSGQRRRRWWKMPLVWIDPVRGYVVALLLSEAFAPVLKASMGQKVTPMMATMFVLFLTVWVQTCGRKNEQETISPASFLAGMLLALLPPVVALSAIIIGAATAVALNSFAAGYVIATLTTAGIGYLFLGRSLWLPIYTVVVASPLLISWLRRTSLVMPVRC